MKEVIRWLHLSKHIYWYLFTGRSKKHHLVSSQIQLFGEPHGPKEYFCSCGYTGE